MSSLRHQFWLVKTLVVRKLFSSLDDLLCKAAFLSRETEFLVDNKKKSNIDCDDIGG